MSRTQFLSDSFLNFYPPFQDQPEKAAKSRDLGHLLPVGPPTASQAYSLPCGHT